VLLTLQGGLDVRKQLFYLAIASLASAAYVGTASAVIGSTATISLVTEFDYPSIGASTLPHGINNNGSVVGTVNFPDGEQAGFQRFKNGTFVELTDPSGNGLDTQAVGINDLGEIDGFYENGGTSAIIGFTLTDGVYADFEGAPVECNLTPCTGDLIGINNAGDLVGGWFPPNGAPEQAFTVLNGTFTPITNSFLANLSAAEAISNNSKRVVGDFFDKSFNSHGFFYTVSNGQIGAINFPGAVQTVIFGVNNHGTLTGRYVDGSGVAHGIAQISGQWATYDFPGADNFTTLEHVNDNNLATGYYNDSAGIAHGFTAQVALSPAS
jgi:probable HAF family extracellular repeat protein